MPSDGIKRRSTKLLFINTQFPPIRGAKLAEEKVPPTSKEINRAVRSYSETRKSISIDRIDNNHYIAVGLDKPVKVIINRGPAGDYLGALNAGAKIQLNGKAGRFVGSTMSDGEVLVNGDVGEGAGVYLKGGLIAVKGDCLGSAGGCMKGGSVIIDGAVRGHVGEAMEGGELIITGDVKGDIGKGIKGGTIFIAGTTSALHDDIKVKPVGTAELEKLKELHRRFKFKKFQSTDALKDFRMIVKV
jgi:glutamate synthase domain-containing protein 3